MSDSPFPTDSEEEMRRAIRAEIEQRDRQRSEQKQKREADRQAGDDAERRRRIYQEELRQFYHDRPGYKEITREDGEVDWVPELEYQRNEKLFDEVLENPDEAKVRLKWVLASSGLFLAGLAVILFLFLANRVTTIEVTCNVPGAQIILDATQLDQYTDAAIREVPAGEHVITVQKPGHVIVGEPIRRIRLKGGQTQNVSFILKPLIESPQVPASQPGVNPGEPKP